MAKQYGIVKIDQITYTTGTAGNEGDASIDVSGLARISESGITVTGTISGISGIFTSGLFSNGTDAAPAITFAGDINTGFYSPGADQVAISTNGSGRLFVSDDGKIGIGTISPSGKLDVSGDALIHGITVGRGGSTAITNTAIGRQALYNHSGIWCTAVGYQALYSNVNGVGNTAVGLIALNSNTSGGSNSAFGQQALNGNISGSNNVAIGSSAGNGITTGSNNTIIGSIGGTAALSDTVIIGAGGAERMRIDSSGRFLLGTSSDSGGALVQINGDRVRIATAKTPASASDTGTTGEICWDANYIYVCTATNTWKRAGINSWVI